MSKEQLYTILKTYQQEGDLPSFVTSLKAAITEPCGLPIFDEMRPFVPLDDQLTYDDLTPPSPMSKVRVIRLLKRGRESLGFAMRGGVEHGTGLFVSSVTPRSQAYSRGLRRGDEIVRINGFAVKGAIYEDCLSLIQAKPHLVLKVRAVGMIPVKDKSGEDVRWEYVDRDETEKDRLCRVYINLDGTAGLGCSICSGPPSLPGIFIQSVKEGGTAEKAGLRVSDQVTGVNQTSFYNITHAQAVAAIKGTTELFITFKRGAGAILFTPNKTHTVEQAQNTQDSPSDENLQRTNDEEEKKKRENEEFEEFRMRQEKKFAEAEAEYLLEEERLRSESFGYTSGGSSTENVSGYGGKSRLDSIEEITEARNKRLQKEKQHLNNLIDEHHERTRSERELRLRRHLQDSREITRELKREITEARNKRLQKEKQHLSNLIDEHHERTRSERELRLRRHLLDSREITRELKREITEARNKRLLKEKQHLNNLIDEHHERTRSERELRLRRHLQDSREITRELKRMPSQLSAAFAQSFTQHGFAHDNVSPSRTGVVQSTAPSLDYSTTFTAEQVAGRQIEIVRIMKGSSFDMDIEGGVDSPLGGKIVVSEVFSGGTVASQGGIHKGDQLMMVDGRSLLDVTKDKALATLDAVNNNSKVNWHVDSATRHGARPPTWR